MIVTQRPRRRQYPPIGTRAELPQSLRFEEEAGERTLF